MSKEEVKVEVGLPTTGFPRLVPFNRFHIEREDGWTVVQFGLVSSSGVLSSYSCVFSHDALEQNKQTLLEYLGRIGQPSEAVTTIWKGAPLEKQAEVADVITMAFRGDTAETCLFSFSLSAATRMAQSGQLEHDQGVPAQPLALLRSNVEVQKQFIVGLYEE